MITARSDADSDLCAWHTLVFTCAADLQVDGEDGVRAGGVFVHQRVAHRSFPPSLLYDPLTLGHTVHRVHGQVPNVHAALWMLLQLCVTSPKYEKTECHPPDENTL